MNYYTLSAKKTKRVFISFHAEDMFAKKLLVEQAKSEKFDLEFINYALNEPFDDKWKTQCKERIKKAAITICLIGKETSQRDAVIWELNTSYALGKRVLGIRIFRDKNHTIPQPIKNNNSKVLYWNINDIVAELNKD
ncbi:MAG: TIR domain-containing protein [Kiritimatiellales bacterium]|nr:TIR domain-containing protein [Kiritimatiellales bacterium]